MIMIHGVRLSQLPDRERLISKLDPLLYAAWKDRHKHIRDQRTACASLAGILLLQRATTQRGLRYSESGRPYLENQKFDLSIAHTTQAVFCALERRGKVDAINGAKVGIDAENLSRISSMRICRLAQRWFSPQEFELFQADPTDVSFLRIWTRKEALVKWTGDGLRSLRDADTLCAELTYGVRFHEYWEDDTLITLCCRSGVTPPSEIRMFSADQLFGRSRKREKNQ